MGYRIAVAGASGYAGGELLRLVAAHPDLEVAAVTAHGNAGQSVGAVHPNLRSLADLVFGETTPAALAGVDLVFLALPHGASAALAADLPGDVRIVDLGSDHRLVDPAAHARYYGGAHHPAWTYGLPELPAQRELIAGSARVANTGCHAVASILAIAPLVAAGLASPDDVVVTSASGTSGAGKSAAVNLLASEIMGDLTAYKVGAHRHTPEIKQAAGVRTLTFVPTLAPMPRGILATVALAPLGSPSADDVRAVLAQAYAGEPFVHVLPAGQQPRTAMTSGSNSAHLQVELDQDSGRIIVTSALDNLGKGAAGQAVQNANLMLGLPETAGLLDRRDRAVSVTAAQGFRAAGVAAGLKSTGLPDVALVVNDGPRATAAAVFTSNRVQAAPVVWSRQVVADGRVQAVVLNSGGANACTGPDGFLDTHRTAEHVADVLGLSAADVVVCSTGLIGDRLPMPLLLGGVDAAARELDRTGGAAAAEAIRTTDSRSKQAVHTVNGVTVGGMAKGAGMLAPGLATMLCVLTTDAVADAATLHAALAAATRVTFDRVDADGCMSTNDTVLLMASGASGVTPAPGELAAAVREVCEALCAAAHRRRRGRDEAGPYRGRQRRHRGRRGGGRPVGGPQQPAQVRAVRQRPQLGPGAGGGRDDDGGVRGRRARRRHERRADLSGRRGR